MNEKKPTVISSAVAKMNLMDIKKMIITQYRENKHQKRTHVQQESILIEYVMVNKIEQCLKNVRRKLFSILNFILSYNINHIEVKHNIEVILIY